LAHESVMKYRGDAPKVLIDSISKPCSGNKEETMKKTAVLVIMSLLVMAPLSAFGVELSFTSVYVDRHPVVTNVFNPWMEEIKKRTNGQVTIKYFNPGTICPDGEMFSAVTNGTVDIASNNTSRAAGALPLNDAAEMPFMSASSESASRAIWKMYTQNKDWADEFKGIKLLTQYSTGLLQLHTVKKSVSKLEDLKGMKITTVSPMGKEILNALGASAILVPTPDVYMSLSRGMADGCFMAIAPLRSFKINEAIKYTTLIDASLTAMWLGMSKTAWDKLTPEQQKIFEETTGDVLAAACGKALDDAAITDSKIMGDNGHTFVKQDDQEKEKWRKATEGIVVEWKKSIESKKKVDVQAILNQLSEANKQFEAQRKK
jgi:TRAP-type transport system periplasmic protein